MKGISRYSFIVMALTFFMIKKSYTQELLPIVKSNVSEVTIIESNEVKTNWHLDAKVKPDIYMTGKNIKSKKLKLITDIDSIQVDLKRGEKFDFVVLLNGKDSCFTRFESPRIIDFSKKQFPEKHDTIPFELTAFNNIRVKSVLNKKDTIYLTFDTGAFGFFLTKKAIGEYFTPSNGTQLTMEDINNATFQIEDIEWNHQQIYPIETTGHFTEGMLGWNMFDGKVLEIDYDNHIMIAHTKRPEISKEYAEFKMEFMKEHFCIDIEMEEESQKYMNRYLFDSGYQRAVMLDDDLLKSSNFPKESLPVINETIMKNSRNEEIPIITVLGDKFHFGKYILKNVPSQINSYNKPSGFTTHILGNEVLKRFNTILDFQENIVYLKPSKYYHVDYTELKGKS